MTSDRATGTAAGGRASKVRVIVLVTLIGAAVFGLYIGYLALANDSFPAQVKPFGNYARVTSETFNGTEFAFNLTWVNASALPLYAQLTSPATDAANTPVCQVGLSSVTSGQTIFMPFTISRPTATLTNVDLSIAVKPAGGGEFTIVYNVASVSAVNGLITPSNISCQQPLGQQ